MVEVAGIVENEDSYNSMDNVQMNFCINSTESTEVLDKISSYKEVYYSHDENLSDKWVNYFDTYDDAFSKYIGKNPNVLEIGVQNGGGLQIASKYFINGNIYGVDIDKKVCEMNLGYEIKTFCFDASDQMSFEKYFAGVEFDTILDDGSHINSEVITTFKNLFPKLKPGGVYVIEDLQTSYWESFGGGYLKDGSSIEFLKTFIDLLNSYHFIDHDLSIRTTNSFIERLSENDLYIQKWLGSITFTDSVAIVKKLYEPKQHSYERVQTGKTCPVS